MSNPIDATRTRPHAPEYGIDTDTDGMLTWAWVSEQMANARNYWIASTRPDGNPHVAPVWGLWFEGTFAFGTEANSRKARNFAHNPQIVVHLESGDDTVILEGVVEKVTDADLRARIARPYRQKYDMGDLGEPLPGDLFTLRVQKALAWQESDFPRTATCWRIIIA